MPVTQYVPFANDPAANTQTPATYASDTQRPIGNQPGVARSEFVNTALRQACTGVAGVAQFAITNGTLDLPDDGNPATFAAALLNAVQAIVSGQQFWKTGDVKATLDAAAQAGWLELNGQFVLQTTYPALYAKGVANGWAITGSGPTLAVKLPDARGEFLRGLDLGRNVDPGRTMGSAQNASRVLANWTSANLAVVGRDTIRNGGLETAAADFDGTPETTYSQSETRYDGSPNGSSVMSTTGIRTRARNIAVRYLIKT